jgi:hypothetical protein
VFDERYVGVIMNKIIKVICAISFVLLCKSVYAADHPRVGPGGIQSEDSRLWNAILKAINSGQVEQVQSAISTCEQAKHAACVTIINTQDSVYKRTPLHWAVIGNKSTAIVRELLNHGARVDLKDSSGKTPLDYAVSSDIRQELGEKTH